MFQAVALDALSGGLANGTCRSCPGHGHLLAHFIDPPGAAWRPVAAPRPPGGCRAAAAPARAAGGAPSGARHRPCGPPRQVHGGAGRARPPRRGRATGSSRSSPPPAAWSPRPSRSTPRCCSRPTADPDQLVVRAGAGCLAGAGGEPVACGPGTQAGFALDQHGSTATADAHPSGPGDPFLTRHGLAGSALVVLPGPAGPLGLLGASRPAPAPSSRTSSRFLEAAATWLSAAMDRHRSEVERQRLYARLAVADRMVSIGTLAGGVAHELNNPLSYVTANLSFVRRGGGRAGQSAGGGRRERPGAGRRRARPARRRRRRRPRRRGEAARAGARPADALARRRRGARPARLDPRAGERHPGRGERDQAPGPGRACSWPPALPPVRANEARLGQVFLNLLINAAHAIPQGPPTRTPSASAASPPPGRASSSR